mgnify:CR=1 FL=1
MELLEDIMTENMQETLSEKLLDQPLAETKTESGRQWLVKCPICYRTCYQSWEITDWRKEKLDWFLCYCGSIFREGLARTDIYNDEYIKQYKEQKQLNTRIEYLERLYLSLIEELTYGRRFLDVGFTVPLFLERLKNRGWLTQGIDLLPNNGYITGDFATYDFGIQRYELIRFNDVLSCFNDPVGAIRKAYKLLAPTGILMLNTPDAKAIYLLQHPIEFGHWGSQHRVFINQCQLRKILKETGFEIVLSWLNMAERLFSTNEIHILAQKPEIRKEREIEGDKKDG